ncbi:MAG: DNA polymerase I [Endozoicomonas sp. (ex Botrylloides leachii)]|nr:DNA polymerase I [Endozoicomonas sp. (ex Botrylloides leachii)]
MPEKTTAPLILVDGSSYLYRAYHASERANLMTSDGQPTGAIRVMTTMLRSLIQQYPKSDVVVIFDAKGKNFRHDMYKDYKATRKPMPDDLRTQVMPIHHIVRAMGLPLLMVEGVEADDVIGTLARQATDKKINTIIVTGDKDIAQLVTEYVTLIDTMKETKIDLDGVVDRFGIPANLIIDYLALMGDASDNIPGMPGVGQKTALALLQGIGGIDQIAQNLDKVAALGFRGSKTFAEKFKEHKEIVLLSYQLATIKTDVHLPVSIEQLKSHPADTAALLALYKQFEFRSMINELEKSAITDKPATPSTVEYELVTDKKTFQAWLEQLKQADLFAFDTETTSLDYMVAELVGVSFSCEQGKAAYVPVGHHYIGAPEQLDRNWVLQALRPLLENPQHKKVGQNLKYDQNILARYGISFKGMAFDTMLESSTLNSTATRHDMNSLAKYYLDTTTTSFEDIAGKGVKQLTFDQIDVEKAALYAAEDADITLRLHQVIYPLLQKEKALPSVFHDIEMPLVDVISRMERNGALVNGELLVNQSIEISQRLQALETDAYQVAGEPFNLSSPKQLQELLFSENKLGLPVIKKTPKGQPSTAEDVLQELALDYPLPRLILEHRSLSKLKYTYTDKLPQMINDTTGRIHTSYHQAGTATGRLSSSDPNLQNIPIRTEEGRRVRQAFIASKGYKLVAADYSQIELRIMAHLSGDKGLLSAFTEGLDIHKATASEVFGVSMENVSKEQRRSAKAINFGLIYGMSAFGLAKQLGISRSSAQAYIDLYFGRYPGVLLYMENTKAMAKDKGYVETLFGRRLHLPEINARNGMRRQGAERTAINAPMQGTAADIIKKAMISVDHWLEKDKLDTRMIMQVHDELVFEVAKKELDTLINGVKERMSSVAHLDVPLLVEVGYGDNWDEAH